MDNQNITCCDVQATVILEAPGGRLRGLCPECYEFFRAEAREAEEAMDDFLKGERK